MEPMTHMLFGAVVARTGFNRKTRMATAAMALAAEAPDIDILMYLGGEVTGFHHHRGYTHTLIGIPFVSALIVGAFYLFWRWRARGGKWHGEAPRWRLLYLFCLVAGLTHILLDFTNNYGVRPWMPFARTWHSWDIVFIVEPLLWMILGGALVLPYFFGMIDREIGSRRRKRGHVAAAIALVLTAALWGFRDFQHRRAVTALNSLTYAGADPLRAAAFPTYINPFRWYGLVETEGFYQLMEVNSLTGEVDPNNRARIFYKPEETPASQAAKRSRMGQVYLDWAQYPMWEVEERTTPDGGYIVRFSDLRFANLPGNRRNVLGAWVALDRELRVVEEGMRGDPEKLLR